MAVTVLALSIVAAATEPRQGGVEGQLPGLRVSDIEFKDVGVRTRQVGDLALRQG